MTRSIRFTLTLWYFGILTATLCLFGVVLYRNVSVTLNRDIDELLVSQADGIEDSIYSFWKAGSKHRSFSHEVQKGNLPALINRWALETHELETLRPVRLLTPDGKPLAASSHWAHLPVPVTERAIQEAKRDLMTYETFHLPDNHFVKLVMFPVFEGNRLLYLVQAGTSLFQADASLGYLRTWLAWMIPVTSVVTSGIGWLLATVMLRPIRKIINQAQRISGSRLHERMEIPPTHDELERLARTFNEMLERLDRAFRRLRQFSAAASHELRTPLTVMKGELELVFRKPRLNEEYQQVLQTHLGVINDMTQVVEQLLAVAHAEDGEPTLDWEPVNLRNLILAVKSNYAKIIEAKGIRVEVKATEPLWVEGERNLLERLVSNLLDNALKHTPSKGLVTFHLGEQGDTATLVVRDTGSGIPPDEIPRIFEKFFAKSPSVQGSQSTGLGLGLCRWIAEVHRGTIEVSSSAGQGATFKVSLPVLASSSIR